MTRYLIKPDRDVIRVCTLSGVCLAYFYSMDDATAFCQNLSRLEMLAAKL